MGPASYPCYCFLSVTNTKTFTTIQNDLCLFENRGNWGCDASLILHSWLNLPEDINWGRGILSSSLISLFRWDEGMGNGDRKSCLTVLLGMLHEMYYKPPSPDMSSHPQSLLHEMSHTAWMQQKHMPFGHQPWVQGHPGSQLMAPWYPLCCSGQPCCYLDSNF